MGTPTEPTLYDAAGGRAGMLRLAAAWHARVLADEVVAHAFSHGYHPDHTERLATYSKAYGDETSVVRMHSGNGPHEEMDRRAIACFDAALDDAGLGGAGIAGERLRAALSAYFAWATTTAMAAYPDSPDDVPDGLTVPRWTWDGPSVGVQGEHGDLAGREHPERRPPEAGAAAGVELRP
jgi:hemoglobin